MTWADLRSLFFNLVGDSRQANTFFSDAQVVGFANKALRDLGQRAMYSTYKFTATAPAGSKGVQVPDVYSAWRGEAELSGISQVLGTTSREELLNDGPGRAEITGVITQWYTDQMRTDSRAFIGFFPVPSADTDITFYFHAIPDSVSDSSPSATVDVPEWATLAILVHMMAQAFRVRAKKEDFEKSALFKAMYEDIADRLICRVNSKINRRESPDMSKDPLKINAPYFVTGTI